MIHKIKALHANGVTIRALASELDISRNTVRKYLRMNESEISARQEDRSRVKRLDAHRQYIVHLLQSYPRLSAVRILRKLKEKVGELDVSNRTARRFVQAIKQTIVVAQKRYYQPVIDMVPGVQCQVDPGELRGVLIDGKESTIYFVVFVLSFSRMMHVSLSLRPIDTLIFIRMHDAAFRYFGGRPEECVYDQTKLVVIREQYRELELNEQFYEYATHAGFTIHACRGYDPESKGKVEAGVKYVKNNALYGESFQSVSSLEHYVAQWLDTTANTRCHGTTGERPVDRLNAKERAHLKPYFTPQCVHPNGQPVMTRKADKTGLISCKSNKYSVPMLYQQSPVGIKEEQGSLLLVDLETREVIASHRLSAGKGVINKNTNHYRDFAKEAAQYEQTIQQQIGEDAAIKLCLLLKYNTPKAYKDQLVAASRILARHEVIDEGLLGKVLERPGLTASMLEQYLDAYATQPQRLAPITEAKVTARSHAMAKRLQDYRHIKHDNAMEVTHDVH